MLSGWLPQHLFTSMNLCLEILDVFSWQGEGGTAWDKQRWCLLNYELRGKKQVYGDCAGGWGGISLFSSCCVSVRCSAPASPHHHLPDFEGWGKKFYLVPQFPLLQSGFAAWGGDGAEGDEGTDVRGGVVLAAGWR